MNVFFWLILLTTIAMLFRMLCKGSIGTIHRPHYIFLLLIIKSKITSRASGTVCYQIIFVIMQMLFMFLFIACSRILLPQVWHVHYFSDGAPSQYKNFKNSANLIHHQDDHQLSGKWHFFATSHGKSPGDGIEGIVSFQNKHVLNVDLKFDWSVDNSPGIIFIKINTDDVQNRVTKFSLEERYSFANSFQGSRIRRHFIPTTNGFEMRIISAGNGASNVSISEIQAPSNITDFVLGIYIACIYGDDWFVGNVVEISKQYNKIHVKFMKKNGKCYLWPTKDDQCWVS